MHLAVFVGLIVIKLSEKSLLCCKHNLSFGLFNKFGLFPIIDFLVDHSDYIISDFIIFENCNEIFEDDVYLFIATVLVGFLRSYGGHDFSGEVVVLGETDWNERFDDLVGA